MFRMDYGRTMVSLRALAAMLLVVSMASSARAAAILEVYNATLTTYLADETAVHDVRPRAIQRAVNLEGSLRAGAAWGLAINGSPFGSQWSGTRRIGDVDLLTGGFSAFEVDLTLPAKMPWVVGRSYNGQQRDENDDHRHSDGYQGRNWFQISQPEIVLYSHDEDPHAQDVLYIVFGADRYIELKRQGTSGAALNTFKAVNGAAGVAVRTPASGGQPELYTYFDQVGTRVVFFGFEDASGAEGQIWQLIGTDGSVAYVGHATTASTAISSGYSGGRITTAFDSSGRRYSYTYTSIDGTQRLTQVKAEKNDSGWVTVGQVDYSYYTNSDSTHGVSGSLKMVTRTTPLMSGPDLVTRSAYRYHTSGNGNGLVKLAVGAEGARLAAAASVDLSSASDSALAAYAAGQYSYDASKRVSLAFFNGECGCGGGFDGEHIFTYGTPAGNSATAGYQNANEYDTRVALPSGEHLWQFFDEVGQAMNRLRADAAPGSTGTNFSLTGVSRNSMGFAHTVYPPSAYTAYDGNAGTGTLAGAYRRTVAGVEASGDLIGMMNQLDTGASDDAGVTDYELTSEFLTLGSVSMRRPVVEKITDAVGAEVEMSVGFHAGTLRVKSISRTHPKVTTAHNGPDTETNSASYYNARGQLVFSQDQLGRWSYTGYNSDGLPSTSIADSHPSGTGIHDEDQGLTGALTQPPDDLLELITTRTFDDQGRVVRTTLPSGRETEQHVTSLANGLIVTLSSPRVDGGDYSGPASYSVRNLAGRTVAEGVISFSGGSTSTAMSSWINTGATDPKAAVSTGTLVRYTAHTYDSAGTRQITTRVYHDISGDGYDETVYEYDATTGRRTKVTDPTGTWTRTVYDSIGRPIETYIGSSEGEELVAETEYDGQGRVSKRTVHVDGSTSQTTEYIYDNRNRVRVTKNPIAPHQVVLYDSRDRTIATGLYKSDSGLSVSTNPTSTTTNRIGLSQTSYDELGRVYKTVQHEVDQDSGALGSAIVTERWHDAGGRVVKESGAQITKTSYDRLGRPLVRYVLATDGDTGYSDALSIAGDIVLEQTRTHYDEFGKTLMRVHVSRSHADGTTTGALESGAGSTGSVSGRASITGMWYDDLDRVTDVVAFGTNGGSSFDRSALSSPPARSDTALRTTTIYNPDGTVHETIDPAGRTTRFSYDDLGRRTKVISNYVNGTPGGTHDDEDHTIEMVYSNGMMVQYKASNPTTGTQTTTYTYDATASNPSKRLLKSVAYPDSGTVTNDYDLLGRLIRTTDQAGNIIDMYYDAAGRMTDRIVTNLASGFDGSVRRIEMDYEVRGLLTEVRQYSAASGGSLLDAVGYEYDGWGNLTALGHAFDGSYDWSLEWDWVYSTGTSGNGRQAVRVAEQRILSDTTTVQRLGYVYDDGVYDDDFSRVTRLREYAGSWNDLASYEYLGSGTLVGTVIHDLPDPVMNLLYTGTDTYSDRMDRFGRVTRSVWTKELSAGDLDFYDVSVAWDRASNITHTVDGVYNGKDMEFSMDGLNRLVGVEEGTWTPGSPGSITTVINTEDWTLDGSGNWKTYDYDADASGGLLVWPSVSVTRTHNTVNEITGWGGGTPPTYDAVGNLTDTGNHPIELGPRLEFIYDAFGRLTQVWHPTNGLVARYRYNGLNQRIAWQDDADGDGTVETTGSDDPWYYILNDHKWRPVAIIIAVDGGGKDAGEWGAPADDDAKELFVYHAAGLNGGGGSSYIDSVLLRDRDANGGYRSASDGVLEERRFYCQNWRHDVVMLLDSSGGRAEGYRYSAYGVPFGMPRADVNGDGTVNMADYNILAAATGNSLGDPGYVVTADINLDGVIDSNDFAILSNTFGATLGRGALSSMTTSGNGGVRNRIGYAGYQFDDAANKYHVRNRVYDPLNGRWLRRDPLGYVDGPNLYEYARGRAQLSTDPLGLEAVLANKLLDYHEFPRVMGTRDGAGSPSVWIDSQLTHAESDLNDTSAVFRSRIYAGEDIDKMNLVDNLSLNCQLHCFNARAEAWCQLSKSSSGNVVNVGTAFFPATAKVNSHSCTIMTERVGPGGNWVKVNFLSSANITVTIYPNFEDDAAPSGQGSFSGSTSSYGVWKCQSDEPGSGGGPQAGGCVPGGGPLECYPGTTPSRVGPTDIIAHHRH